MTVHLSKVDHFKDTPPFKCPRKVVTYVDRVDDSDMELDAVVGELRRLVTGHDIGVDITSTTILVFSPTAKDSPTRSYWRALAYRDSETPDGS